MSETSSPSVPPKVIVSRPVDEVANKGAQRSGRRKNLGPHRNSQEQGRSSGSGEWIDVDDTPPRRKRSTRRTSSRRNEHSTRSTVGSGSESELARYFPSLSRILESGESTVGSRPASRGLDTSRRTEKSSVRRHRNQDDAASTYRRPIRHRAGGVQRRVDSHFKVNPSLLSVLSSLTASTDKSSGSGSTITQRSYDRRGSDSSRTPVGMPRRSVSTSDVGSTTSTRSRPKSPNVFDYMVASTVSDDNDNRSVISSSSSHYEPSVAGSSEAPDTPSTQSTFPSPTATRSHSVAELRRKYDPQYASSEVSSAVSDGQSPELPVRSMQAPSVSDVEEDDEEQSIAPTAPSELSFQSRERSVSRSSRGSRSSRRSASQLSQQDEARRQHMAHASQPYPTHYINPVYGQHRSSSISSTHSAQHGYHMAMQQYQWPSPPALPPHPAAMNGHLESVEPPHAPDAPDLTLRTIAGYEKLALELATQDSSVKPLYRKFEYLNHRILLHLQDELAELEEHLRTLDEIIAQMEPSSPPAEKPRTPASRRAETYNGTEIHHQRTALLGRIFIKTEQYNRAMTAYTSLTKSSSQAEAEQVEAYTSWLKTHNPVHDSETRFLGHAADLIAPSAPAPHPSGTAFSLTPGALAAYLPIALMLPLLLFSLIPSLAGRLAVTALIAAGAFLVVGTTRVRTLLPQREWAVCGAVYVLVMAAVAGCVPVYGS